MDVDDLEELMKEFQDWNKAEILEYDYRDFPRLELGNLQPLYSKFQTDFEEFQYKELTRAGAKQVTNIRKEIAEITAGIKILERQKKDAQKILDQEELKYESIRSLVLSDDLPKKDLNEQKIVVLRARKTIKAVSYTHLTLPTICSV